jgi:hypothetical protein
MVRERIDELEWSGTLFAGGRASMTFNGLAAPPLWSTTVDVRMAEEEEEEEAEGEEEDDEDEEFDDEEFEDDLDDDEDEEEEAEEAEGDY